MHLADRDPIQISLLRTLMACSVFMQAFDERAARSTSPSLLSATVGQKLLSRLDDGSGSASPERVIALWTEEGIRNSRDILQVSQPVSLMSLDASSDTHSAISCHCTG